jgi:hypothetical protein
MITPTILNSMSFAELATAMIGFAPSPTSTAAQPLQVADLGDADDDRQEGDRRNDHSDKPDEQVAEHLQGLSEGRVEVPKQDAEDQPGHDLDRHVPEDTLWHRGHRQSLMCIGAIRAGVDALSGRQLSAMSLQRNWHTSLPLTSIFEFLIFQL